MEEKLREYAHLIVSVGLNLQKGQTLILSSPVECAPFARLCVSAAYDLGAGEVVLNWTDDCITRERFLRAQDAAFEMPRPWRRAFFTDYAGLSAHRCGGPRNAAGRIARAARRRAAHLVRRARDL